MNKFCNDYYMQRYIWLGYDEVQGFYAFDLDIDEQPSLPEVNEVCDLIDYQAACWCGPRIEVYRYLTDFSNPLPIESIDQLSAAAAI